MKGYKGFNPGMICRGKQYAENTVFEEDTAKICESGMHFCARPIDVLRYYPPCDEHGNPNDFCVVEALDDAVTDDKKIYCTRKLKVGEKIGLDGLINAEVKHIMADINEINEETKAVNSGDGSAAVNSGDGSAAVNSGYSSAAVNSGDGSAAVNSGVGSAAVNSGYSSAAINSGVGSAAVNSGYSSAAISIGGSSAAVNSGDGSAAINSGVGSAAVNSGYSSAAISIGGSSAAVNSGEEGVAASLGINGKAKSALGGWIVLTEWKFDKKHEEWHRVDLKSAQVDGKKIKADTWYILKNGEFVEDKNDNDR